MKVDIFAPQQTEIVSGLQAQKIMLYGDSDTGKTFQSTRLPKPMLLMAESGGNSRSCPKFPITSWDDFTVIVKQLTSDYDKASKVYQTVIIDVVEELVARAEEKVALRYGVLEVGMVQKASEGNPNGYMVARAMFKKQINLLTMFGYTVVFLSHGQKVEATDELTGEVYSRVIPYGSDKEKGSTKFVRNLCDFVFFLKAQGIDAESGNTIYSKALCKETRGAFARSRYAIQTFIEPFTAENLMTAIEKAIEQSAKDENVGLKEFKISNNAMTKEDYFDLIRPYCAKLFKLYPSYVNETIEEQLGVGKKITNATDDEITELGNIYNEFVSFSCDRGIVIE